MYRQNTETASDGDQRCLRTQHNTETQGGERGRDDAEQLDGLYRSAGLETLRGLMAARSRQVANGQSDQYPTEGHPWQRPPERLTVEPEAPWEVSEDLRLKFRHRVQEEVRHRGHRNTDDGPEHKEDEVAPGSDDISRIGGGCWIRRSGGVGHSRNLGRLVGTRVARWPPTQNP